jgi:type I restriction enzyme M protein
MARKKAEYKTGDNASGASLGLEQKLWAAADKMRSYMDPAEYKHVVLGLIFLE